MKKIIFNNEINKAIAYCMKKDKSMLCYGLGTTDPKGVFDTTINLEKKFGKKRVFDVPSSENALTGISIGLALKGIRSVVTHQRMDFFFLAFDQLINAAAKWYYMFGQKTSIPITIRLIVGRGWGQGPTHSQSFQSMLSSVPGLKVVMPSLPENAKSLLISSILDPNPVVFIEHRWLHGTIGKNKKSKFKKNEHEKSIILNKGNQLTIISMSYMTLEALRVLKRLPNDARKKIEILDLISIKPLDKKKIINSVKKTGRVLILDTGPKTNSVSSEIISIINENIFSYLKSAPERLCLPDYPEPTGYSLTKNFYNNSNDVLIKIQKILNLKKISLVDLPLHHDVPGDWFKGPF